jgi:beta-lactamase regulating signal transducer with metallopeptidase domain
MLFVDVALRSALILLAAWIATHALRRAAASTRHLVWTLAMIAVLALPALMVALPGWEILPEVVGGPEGPYNDSVARPFRAAEVVAQPFRAAEIVGQPFRAADTEALPYAVWLLVALPLLLRVPCGIVAVGRLVSRARPAGARWRALFDEALAGTATKHPIRLLVSREIAVPMTWGGARPVLLLPENSREWSDERCRVVLLHELAHILRADWLSHTLGRVVVAAHWFNPLAWIAMRAMTRERERACDDYVLARGACPTDYAQHLLDIARADTHGRAWVIAPAMARRSELEGRLLSILTPHPHNGHALARRAAMLGALLVASTVAVARPAASTAIPAATPEAPAPQPPAFVPPTISGIEEVQADRIERQRQKTARTAVIRELEHPDDDVREKSVIALAIRSDPDVIDPLLRALEDPSSQVREKAAMGLAFRRRPDVVEALLAAADDPDSQVREKVIFALGLSGDDRAIAALTTALDDSDAQVREKATQGLAWSGLFRR